MSLELIELGKNVRCPTDMLCLPQDEATRVTLAKMQLAFNRFAGRAGFTPIVVDGKPGEETLKAARASGQWILNNYSLAANAPGFREPIRNTAFATGVQGMTSNVERITFVWTAIANIANLPEATRFATGGDKGKRTTPKQEQAAPPPAQDSAPSGFPKMGLILGGLAVGGLVYLATKRTKR